MSANKIVRVARAIFNADALAARVSACMGNVATMRVVSAELAKLTKDQLAIVQRKAMLAYLASKSNANSDEARAKFATRVLDGAGHGSSAKLKSGQARRTKAEEDTYNAARQMWHRVKSAAGVAKNPNKTAPRKGAKGSKPGKGKGAATLHSAPFGSKAAAPKIKDAGELYAYLQLQAKAMLSTVEKNAKACDVSVRSAVGEFVVNLASAVKVAAEPKG